jgi:hypothetical protein
MIEATVNINQLLEVISRLDYEEKISVMESIIGMIKKEPDILAPEEKTKLMDLKGLGASVWKDTDIEKYLKDERRWE